jgi:uncharacterized damage-inducible protein DinB
MQEYLLRLYEYNHWANQKHLDCWPRLPQVPARAQLLMSHVLVAQKLWLSRILGSPDLSLHIWESRPLPDLLTLAEANHQSWRAYLLTADPAELARMMTYQNFQKITYTNAVQDIVVHTANHATYHRAQMAQLYRQAYPDFVPPNTDFITFARETSGQAG